MKAYEKQKKQEEKELKELADAERRDKISKFMSGEKSILSKSMDTFAKSDSDGNDIVMLICRLENIYSNATCFFSISAKFALVV